MAEFTSNAAVILCCQCGIEISPNAVNLCASCLRSAVDITEGINKELTIHSCRSCARFLLPPWSSVQLESKELLAACLRKIPGLSKVKLIDAVWIWTEPHSLRLKIKLTIQKEVMNGAILQQACVITYTIRNQQCQHCESSYAQGAWHAVVQIRQRVSHKRTFFYLEQLLLKHNAHSECINIVTFRDGMDFYFTDRQPAVRFIDFLESHIPMKVKYSRKLVSADHSDNVADFKHNYIVDVVPLCKDDLLILPKDLANNLSDISRLVIIKSIGAGIHVVDPHTGERQEISTEKYHRYNFIATMTSRSLIKYYVLSIDPIIAQSRPSAKRRGFDRKTRLAECVVARERDFGVNDTQFTCITHLGHVLKEGDLVMGYDLSNASWTNDETGLKKDLPDLILVRKYYRNKGERIWALKNFEVDEVAPVTHKDQEEMDEEYEEFLQELEADKEMRNKLRIYKKQAPVAAGGGGRTAMDEDDSDDEGVKIDELLDDLVLSNEEHVLLSASEACSVPSFNYDVLKVDEGDEDDV